MFMQQKEQIKVQQTHFSLKDDLTIYGQSSGVMKIEILSILVFCFSVVFNLCLVFNICKIDSSFFPFVD